MRRVLLLAALAASAAADAGARPDANLLIRPGQGIGKVRLGMTEAELRSAMGRPRSVIPRSGAFGLRTLEYEYGYAAYVVRLFGRTGRLRVVRVSTTLASERTPARVGVGSREATLLRTYRRLRCERLRTGSIAGVVYVGNQQRDCTLVAPSGRRTVFTSWIRRNETIGENISVDRWHRQARVIEVSVSATS
jgi:hypothetical protein